MWDSVVYFCVKVPTNESDKVCSLRHVLDGKDWCLLIRVVKLVNFCSGDKS